MPPPAPFKAASSHPAPSVSQTRAGTAPAEPCCQFLSAHPPPPAWIPRKPPWLPHLLLSRNAEIWPVPRGALAWLCHLGWMEAASPAGAQGGYGTVCPPATHCLHPEAAAASSPAGEQLPPDRAHRKHRGIYRALRAPCTNSGKNLHSVKNNLLHQSCTGAAASGCAPSTLLGPQVLEGGCRTLFTIEMGCGAFPGLFLTFSAVSSPCVSFHLPPF